MTTLQGYKVVSSQEMAAIEKQSIEAGASTEEYMLKAGEEIAKQTVDFVEKRARNKKCILLIGKGNNGGDAYIAGCSLLSHGFLVKAIRLFSSDQASPLLQKQEKKFEQVGGKIVFPQSASEVQFFPDGIILDGLFGTGFQGKLEKFLADVIYLANQSHIPILSIDIPSGVDGTSGQVQHTAIQAEKTFFLGLPKLGCFIGSGFNYVGELSYVDFGMDMTYIQKAKAKAYFLNEKALPPLLPPLIRTRHKYSSGYILALAGSPGMPGAALLACLSALRAGAGIIRLFHPEGMEKELSSAPYELLRTSLPPGDISPVLEESKRASACLIGPGLGRKSQTLSLLQDLLPSLALPCVIDADALFHLSSSLETLPSSAILTPHHKEMLRLLGRESFPEGEMLVLCQQFVEERQVTLVLKGAPTFIFHPQTPPLISLRGDPGMATAGTGDVLTGILAALLAQNLPPHHAAPLGVALHGFAGERAAQQKTSYSLIATDIIDELPQAFLQYQRK